MAELSVKIGADIKELQSKIDRAEKDLKGFEKQSLRSGKNISKFGDEASKGMGKFGKSTANAVPAVQEFSRVIQDAPFGIQGVGNNIQQLTANFGNLAKSAGGSGAALRLMVGALTGPAGILLAVSAVTSLLTVYSDELFSSAGATNKLAEATAKYVAEARTEVTTLNSLIKIATDEANSKKVRQGAIDEINKNYSKYLGNLDLESIKTDAVTASVKELTAALITKAKIQGLESLITEKTSDSVEDILSAEQKREKALKSLNSEVNKAIQGNAFFNQILGNVEGPRARLKAFIELTQRQDDVGAAARNASAGVNIALSAFKSASQEVKELNKELDSAIDPLVNLQQKFKTTQLEAEAKIINADDGLIVIKGTKVDPKVREEINAKISELTTELDALGLDIELGNLNLKQLNDLQKKVDAYKATIFDIETEEQNALKIKGIAEDVAKSIDKIYENTGARAIDDLEFDISLQGGAQAFNEIQAIQDKVIELSRILNSLDLKAEVDLEGLNLDQLTAFESKLRNGLQVANVFTNSLSSSFGAMASQISQDMSTGNAAVDAFVGAMLQSLAQLLSQLVASLVTEQIVANSKAAIAGTAASAQGVQIATSAATALGPAGFVALPGLLAATQSEIAAALALAKIPKFALGGFSGDDTLAMLNRNELILRPREQAALYNAIRGHSLNNLGNNVRESNMDVFGEVVLRGNNQYIQLRRSERRMDRFYSS